MSEKEIIINKEKDAEGNIVYAVASTEWEGTRYYGAEFPIVIELE